MNGRIQPLDSVARNSLLQIRTKQSVFLKAAKPDLMASQGTNLTAIEWLEAERMIQVPGGMIASIDRQEDLQDIGGPRFQKRLDHQFPTEALEAPSENRRVISC